MEPPILNRSRKLSSTYKLPQLTLFLVMKTAPIAIGGTIVTLIGTIASIYWDKQSLRSFRLEVYAELAKLWGSNPVLELNVENLMRSHPEVWQNLQVLYGTLKQIPKLKRSACCNRNRLNAEMQVRDPSQIRDPSVGATARLLSQGHAR